MYSRALLARISRLPLPPAGLVAVDRGGLELLAGDEGPPKLRHAAAIAADHHQRGVGPAAQLPRLLSLALQREGRGGRRAEGLDTNALALDDARLELATAQAVDHTLVARVEGVVVLVLRRRRGEGRGVRGEG
eukprot:6188816-Pleurochrysis_carterae.AAC.1